MPIPAWNTAWKPTKAGSDRDVAPAVATTRFQDYEQRVPQGVAHVEAGTEFRLQFDVHFTVAEAIEAFLKARAGVEAFTYADKSLQGSVTYTVVCQRWRRSPGRGVREVVSATFRVVPLEPV